MRGGLLDFRFLSEITTSSHLTKAGRVFVQDVDQILKRLDQDLERAILRGRAMSRTSRFASALLPYSPFASLRVTSQSYWGCGKAGFRHFDLRLRILPTDRTSDRC